MIGRWLAHMGGGQEDILRLAPTDRAKFTTLGGVLIGTAALAGVSAYFAIVTTLRLGAVAGAVVGFLWALLILSLDRQLVTTMTRQGGWKRNMQLAVPRLLLAILLGAVISEPLVLQIFQREITNQLRTDQATLRGNVQQNLDANPNFARIGPLTQQVNDLKNVDRAPEVAPLLADVINLRSQRDQLNREVGCEVAPGQDCAARPLGEGPAFREAQRKLEVVRADLARLEPQLTQAQQAAQIRIDAELRDPSTAVGRANQDLTNLRNDRAAVQQGLNEASDENIGIAAQIKALNDLSRNNPTVLAAHIVLFLLFAAIEILPILAKLLSLGGEKTLYERILERREEELFDDSGRDFGHYRDTEKLRTDTAMQLERDRAESQLAAGRNANAKLVEKQSEIAAQAIEVWGRVAATRNSEELDRWARDQTTRRARAPRRTAYTPADRDDQQTATAQAARRQELVDQNWSDAPTTWSDETVRTANGRTDPLGEHWRSDETRY